MADPSLPAHLDRVMDVIGNLRTPDLQRLGVWPSISLQAPKVELEDVDCAYDTLEVAASRFTCEAVAHYVCDYGDGDTVSDELLLLAAGRFENGDAVLESLAPQPRSDHITLAEAA